MTDASATFSLVLVAFLGLLLGSLVVRRRRTPLDLRRIPAYNRLIRVVNEAVESDQAVHYSFGASSVGTESTVAAFVSSGLMQHMVSRTAFHQKSPLISLSDPMTLALANDTLRRAYGSRGQLDSLQRTAVAWYPQGERSVVFAAAAAGYGASQDVAAHVMSGVLGAELAFFTEVGLRREQQVIAHSTALDGQAVAHVMADTHIIGEELFAVDAYLDPRNDLYVGSLIALDTLRWTVIIFGILLGVLLNAVNS